MLQTINFATSRFPPVGSPRPKYRTTPFSIMRPVWTCPRPVNIPIACNKQGGAIAIYPGWLATATGLAAAAPPGAATLLPPHNLGETDGQQACSTLTQHKF
jgi:hypothetical protein